MPKISRNIHEDEYTSKKVMNPTQYSVFQKACPPRDLDSTTSWKTQHTKNISSLSAT